MDEIGFGPKRERRPSSPRLRALGLAGAITAAAAAAIAIAVTATAAHHGAASPVPAAQSAAAIPVPLPQAANMACPPVQPTWPDLGALPVSLRPGALKLVVDGQFSGRCPPP